LLPPKNTLTKLKLESHKILDFNKRVIWTMSLALHPVD
jgi:hypothetical protein